MTKKINKRKRLIRRIEENNCSLFQVFQTIKNFCIHPMNNHRSVFYRFISERKSSKCSKCTVETKIRIEQTRLQ